LFLTKPDDELADAGGYYNNPTRFSHVLVQDDGSNRARFSIVAAGMEDGQYTGLRYGVENESARLNVNAVSIWDAKSAGTGRTVLMNLPGMTEEIADSILDWLDADDTARDFGAESNEYSAMSPAYAPKNGPIDSVEELLLVRGVTPALLFGLDTNRNGMVDPGEQNGTLPQDVDNSDGSFNRGWSAYLTVNSLEANTNRERKPRINVNSNDLEQLYNDMTGVIDAAWATFIVAYRQNGAASGNSTNALPATARAINFSNTGNTQINTMLDLIGINVSVTFPGDTQATLISSPFQSDTSSMNSYLPQLMDNLTVFTGTTVAGRINVNQAPRTVLMCVPGMTKELVDKIIAVREPEPSKDQAGRNYETWLMAEGIVNSTQMKSLTPYLTGGGDVFRAQVTGYYDGGGPTARCEALIDTTGAVGRLLLWRDISHLGRGFTPAMLNSASENGAEKMQTAK
jgi:DNA uptake protein ComE-like DNA-binding protein